MTLSNKQRKFIARNHDRMSVSKMASRLGASAKEIEREIAAGAGEGAASPTELSRVLDKASIMILFAIAALTPFAVRPALYDQTNLPQTVFFIMGALLLSAVFCLKSYFSPKSAVALPTVFYPLAAFTAWGGLSIFWAANAYEAVTIWLPWAACLFFFSAAFNISDSRERRLLLLKGLFFSGTAVALLGILQHLGGDVLQHMGGENWFGVKQAEPPASTFTNRNMAVHFIVLTLPLGAGFFLQEKRGWPAAAFLVCTTLMLNYLFYTSNRAGWLCLLLQIAVFAALLLLYKIKTGAIGVNRGKRISLAVCLALFLVLFNCGPKGLEWQFGKIFQRVSVLTQSNMESPGTSPKTSPSAEKWQDSPAAPGKYDASKRLRLDIWANTLAMIKEHPLLGVGMGSHKVLYPIYSRRAKVEGVFSEESQLSNVHNDYLQIAAELGLPGLAMALWLGVSAFFILLRLFRKENGEEKFLVIALAACLAGISLNAAASFPFQRMVPLLVVSLYLAMLAGWDSKYQEKPPRITAPPARVWLVCAAAFTGLLIAAGWAGNRAMKADEQYKWLDVGESAANWNLVISKGKQVLADDPYRVKARSYLGRAYLEKRMPEKAAPELEKVVQAYPYHMNALLNLGVAYGTMGENEKALEVYEKVLQIKPDYAKVHNNIGNVQMNTGKIPEAMEAFTKAAELDGGNPQIWMNLGVAAFKARDFEKAATAFEKCAVLAPGWARANRNAGHLLMQIGQREKGLRYLQIADALEKAEKQPNATQ
ncbi:O-antigen ligase [Desulfatibacillum alkenivorans DSM 16219]|uniref:O-antigen ligase n=1 Tax=Desulfatibacillum alkenivorans DSM 16219 TaxID=1121393 RepID=A0A1M6P3G9_9BACT|nr:tetratricopeptide repeat protein [Desulfatibacillum alkenivorans]SHK02481.1 O-antigen ligase [Desulfatibacillum alkenivorans DSM 16219]